jgi:hypothetical protein
MPMTPNITRYMKQTMKDSMLTIGALHACREALGASAEDPPPGARLSTIVFISPSIHSKQLVGLIKPPTLPQYRAAFARQGRQR